MYIIHIGESEVTSDKKKKKKKAKEREEGKLAQGIECLPSQSCVVQEPLPSRFVVATIYMDITDIPTPNYNNIVHG